MFQRNEDLDLGELIQKYLGPAIVGFFVFVLPAIRAALTAKKDREAAKRRAEERGSGAPGEAAEGRKVWEDLLQGRGAPPSAPAPPPLPPRSRIPVQELEPSEVEEESLEEHEPAPLVELPSSRLPSAREDAPGEEAGAEELAAAREREEAARQVAVAAAEYEAASPYRSDVAPAPASVIPAAAPAAAPQRAAERRLFPQGSAAERLSALRRAVVLREVLGPPLGLR